jgi:hypothetical protein
VTLKNVELDAHHTPRLENDNSMGYESGVVDEDLEEGRIPVVKAVEVDALDEDDRANEPRGGLVFVPVQGEGESVVERGLQLCNVGVDCFRSFEIHGPSV